MPKKVRDISLAGVYIEDTNPLPTGHRLHLLFKQAKPSPLGLRGVIRRAERGHGMGVEFVDTAPERSNHLKRLLHTFSQTPALPAVTVESAGAASGVDTLEWGPEEIPVALDDGYRLPPPPEPEEEIEQPPPAPKASPLLFYAVLIGAFIGALALGLAFLHYRGQGEKVPAAVTPAAEAEAETETQVPAGVAGKAETQPKTAAEASAAVPQTPPVTPTSEAGFVVQVGAYEERGKSEALARRVSTFYPGTVVIAPAQVKGKTFYRVQIPVRTREEARQLAARLAKEQKIDAWVRPLP
jgi:hypothetical protein